MEPGKHNGTDVPVFTCRQPEPPINITGSILMIQKDIILLDGLWPAVMAGSTFYTPLTVQQALETAIAIINDKDDMSRVQLKASNDAHHPLLNEKNG
jgi:hypothetical protein